MKNTIPYIFLIFSLTTSCKAQNTNPKTEKMKTFDIETFNNKSINKEYSFTTTDSTIIEQTEWSNEYAEKVKPKNTYFFTINYYYKDGSLKSEGEYFDFNFNKGIWKEYDEQGNLINKTDYDAPFKFKWEDILKIIKKRELDMDAYGFRVTRSAESNPIWYIRWNKNAEKQILGMIEIDGTTGKIIKEYEEPYPLED